MYVVYLFAFNQGPAQFYTNVLGFSLDGETIEAEAPNESVWIVPGTITE